MQSKEYQNIIVTLERGMDEVQRGYINSQRAVITLKTNEFNLVRRHSAMLEVETHLRKENSTLKADLRDLDKTARETISRLLRAKNEALFKVDNLLKKLDGKPKQMQKVLFPLPLLTSFLVESVPASQVAQIDNRLQSFISKTRVLLQREQEWISQKALIDTEVKEIKRLKEENDKLTILYTQEKLQHEKMESAFDGLTNQFASVRDVLKMNLQPLAYLFFSRVVLHLKNS
jgi:hypothetical protein